MLQELEEINNKVLTDKEMKKALEKSKTEY